MTEVTHKTEWKSRPQPYVRPRISPRDIERARIAAAARQEVREKQAQRRSAVFFFFLLVLCGLGLFWLVGTEAGTQFMDWVDAL